MTPDQANNAFHALQFLFDLLGIVSSPKKDCPPSTLMIFLGILFKSGAMTSSIPDDKISAFGTYPADPTDAKHISSSPPVDSWSYVICHCLCLSSQNLHVHSPQQSPRPPQAWPSVHLNRNLFRSQMVAQPPSTLQWCFSHLIPPSYTPNILATTHVQWCSCHIGLECFCIQFQSEILANDDYHINVKELIAIIAALCIWCSQCWYSDFDSLRQQQYNCTCHQ